MNERPRWRRAWGFFFAPVRVWWRWAGQRKTWKGKAGAYGGPVIAVLVLLIAIGSVSGAEDNDKDAAGPPASEATTETSEPTDTPRPTATAAATDTPEPTSTPKPTNTPVPPTDTPVPLDDRPEAEAIRATVHGYFDAYTDLVGAVVTGAQTNAIPILRLVDDRADAECGGIVAHGYAHVLMAQQMRERFEVTGITMNDLDVDGRGLAYADVDLSRIDADTGELVFTEAHGYYFQPDTLSPTGWVFTVGPDEPDLHYPDGHDGPVYDPLFEVISFCGR